jgi:hypothetical protein
MQLSPHSTQHDPFHLDEGDEPDIPQMIRRLELLTRRRVESLFAGAYQASFQGQGMVFADVRPYQPGDEVRSIDWNVSARMGMRELYVKQFIEERERTVLLVWDASTSMKLGHHRRSKQELCAEVAMALAMSASHNGDRVGLIVFADDIVDYIAPQRGRKHIMRMVQRLLQPIPLSHETSQTNLKDALLFLNRISPRHTIAFIMSDFLGEHHEGIWQMLARRCECIPVVFSTPKEHVLFPPLEEGNTTREPSFWLRSWSAWLVACGFLTVGALAGPNGWMAGLVAASLVALFGWSLRPNATPAVCQLQTLEEHLPLAVDSQQTHTHNAFLAAAEQRQSQQNDHMRRLQLNAIQLTTEEDYLAELLRYFRQRQSR